MVTNNMSRKEKLVSQEKKSKYDHNHRLSIDSMIDKAENTYPIHQIGEEIKYSLEIIGVDVDLLNEIDIKPSPEQVNGDFGFHCAPLVRKFKRHPSEIAQQIADQMPINPNGLLESYEANGSYVNVKLNYGKFADLVRNKVFEMGVNYGKERIGTGKRIIIDMSSPNIAKRMSIGHLRSTIIGDSLARIFSYLDFEVIKDNHLGDWGTQFGYLLRAIELWGDDNVIAKNPIEELQKLYVRISDASDPDSELYKNLSREDAKQQAEEVKTEARRWFKKLEEGDPDARAKWQQIVDWSMQEFQKMYDVLKVDFDWVRGESYYQGMLSDTIKKIKESGIATNSNGALVINMDDVGLGVAMVQKSDGTTLYLTREIAAAIHRNDIERAHKMIYVVGEDQKFYFQQFFEILRRMGYPIADQSRHVYFGMIRLPEGKMSTRKGRVILLEDVINEAFNRTRQLVKKTTHIVSDREKEELVRQVAVGALKWNDLMADPRRSIVFNWDAMLSMDGNSAPYVQYSYARAISLLAESDLKILAKAQVLPDHQTEKVLIKIVAGFPEAIKSAAESYNPSKIALHIYELAKNFNAFYHQLSVLKAETEEKKLSRLVITACVAQTIKNGLNLLGIESPARM